MSTIEIRNLTKKFGEFVAVKDVDLKVDAGEVVCLFGTVRLRQNHHIAHDRWP